MYTNDHGHLVTYPCVRAILMLFNIAFWLSGLSLIWIGMWMQTDYLKYLRINASYSDIAPLVMIVAGAIILFASSLACSCIVKIHSSMLIFYGGFLITALFSLISLSIYVHTYKGELLDGVSSGISKEIQSYSGSKNATGAEHLLDFVQQNLRCCGNESFLDWPDSSVPNSCFKQRRTDPTKVEVSRVFEVGCYYKLRSSINDNFTTIGVSTSLIALFPLFGSILSFGLSMMYQKGGYEIII
ncbi:tetraspanin-6-like [Stomoxys calcitrans]|uniref:tetraspanin-6-like n=1 Tax=Stomoxys calcitrans TaxID=35570 RepID=UPI0027E3AEB2|nr:tetraspanin-6-like [Stomoxys calcitrans]